MESSYTYDTEGRILGIEAELTRYGSDDHYTSTVVREYDEDGRLIHDVEQGGILGSPQVNAYFSFDDFGRVVKADNEDGSYTIYQYNDSSEEHPVEIREYNSKGQLGSTRVLEYDIDGSNCTYEAIYSSSGSMTYEHVYEYENLSDAVSNPFATQSERAGAGSPNGLKDGSETVERTEADFIGTWYLIGALHGPSRTAEDVWFTEDHFNDCRDELVISSDGTYDMFDGEYSGSWGHYLYGMCEINVDGEDKWLTLSEKGDSVYLSIADVAEERRWIFTNKYLGYTI